ncbi:MAG: maleylpyruvate isomerase family mycothiol-dependent enzyme [Acidobacteriia bacterium]|nr:maleylpyruvate isomerase family mycothiol-dependent enzyme [Terriglobia bacterium]
MKPIVTVPLFPKLERMLVELLRSLSPGDWEKQTLAPKWKIKDVTAHLLDTALRGVSMGRDGHFHETAKITSNEELAAFINRLNQEGVSFYRRLSPGVLISMIEVASGLLSEFHASLDPFATSPIAVSWAGEERSANWFNTAREFTERWHHQQQIRLAVDKPGIMTPEFYFPVLDCFMRALPFTYRTRTARAGTYAQFNVSGECGGNWYLYREGESWRLAQTPIGERVSDTTIPQEIAWRIFTKGIDRDSAMSHVKVSGDTSLGLHILGMISIVA